MIKMVQIKTNEENRKGWQQLPYYEWLCIYIIMLPQSRESNRSIISRPQSQPYLDAQPAFNQSFYNQKLSSQNYTSSEYIKRYLNETNLSFTVQKMMGVLLKLDKLPENPYNLMYRLIHHEAIYQNLRRFYSLGREYQSMINYFLQPAGDNESQREHSQHIDSFCRLRMKDRELHLNEKLLGYINPTNLFIFSKIVQSRRVVQKCKVMCDKYNMQSAYFSLGGPVVLNLRGNRGSTEVPVKLPKQQPERSLYCGQAMLNCTIYVNSNREISKSFQDFSDFILQDLVEMIQYKDQNLTIYLQKLQLFNIDEIFNVIEFSREQILHSGSSVQKEIVRNIEKENMIIRAKAVYRLSRDLAGVVGEEFITVYKEYVLMALVDGSLTALSNQPLKYALREAFLDPIALQTILDHQQYRHKQLSGQFKIEMVHTLTHHLKNQNLTQLAWDIFYCILHEDGGEENQQLLQDLNQTLSYLLLSPISFVHKLSHTLRCVRWLTLPSFPTLSQDEAYRLILQAQREITSFIQRGNYIYWQLQIFYQAIKRLLGVIVQFKQLKANCISFIVDHALLLLSGVTNNFNQILLVLQGNVLSYINVIRNVAAQQEGVISYEEYIKHKELPTRVLRLQDEIKKGKKQLNLSENQVKMILISKYVSHYGLYDKIYRFYWTLFTGKKPTYPLSQFLKLLMLNSTQCSYQLFKDNYEKPKVKVQANQVSDLTIYELNSPQTSVVFYSLSPSALSLYTLKEYKSVLDILLPFFQEEAQEQALGFRYGSKTTIQTNPLAETRKRNRVTLAVKCLQVGENIGEEITSFNQCKVLVDVLLYRTFSNKYDLYSYLLDYLHELMDRLDKQGYSVLGIFPYSQNEYNLLGDQEFVYSRLLNEDSSLRFDYKKKASVDRFSKFLEGVLSQGKFIQVKLIYSQRDILKVMKVGFNFYYRNPPQSPIFSIFRPNFLAQRVYSSKKDLLAWCEASGPKVMKEMLASAKATSKDVALQSVRRLQQQQQVSIIDILSEKETGQQQQKHKDKGKFYKQSPFYNLFQRSLQMLQNIQILIEYLKSDRRGRYELSHIRKIYSLLKYYLVDKCLAKDDFIYSEGTAVSIINLLTYLQEYLDRHPDNNGEERELLYLERIITKLANLVKFQEISCSLCIYQSLNSVPESELT